jgi:3-oxoacyl-[acyl-carrier-protein] synthase III
MRLAAYAKHIPLERLPVADCVTAAGYSRAEAKAFLRIFGIAHVHAYPRDQLLSELLSKILDLLHDNADEQAMLPDALVYVHASPLHALKVAEVLETLSLSHPLLRDVEQIYEMDQNCCATLFWALKAAQNMLKQGAARSVAIIAGETFSALPLSERYMPACTILGDAFTGLLLDRRKDGPQIDEIVLQSNPEYHFGLYGTTGEIHRFNRAHTGLVHEVLRALDFPAGNDEPILPHNINSFSWDQYCAATSTKRENVWLELLADFGHCCSTDAFLNLDRFLQTENLGSAVLLGVGQGGFVGGCRVTKAPLGARNAAG